MGVPHSYVSGVGSEGVSHSSDSEGVPYSSDPEGSFEVVPHSSHSEVASEGIFLSPDSEVSSEGIPHSSDSEGVPEGGSLMQQRGARSAPQSPTGTAVLMDSRSFTGSLKDPL